MIDHSPQIEAATDPAGQSERISRIVVPADVVARSHPSGHSVPIIAMKPKPRRAHPYRTVGVLVLLAVLALIGLGVAGHYGIEAQREAGYRLTCEVSGASAGTVCHWEKIQVDGPDRT